MKDLALPFFLGLIILAHVSDAAAITCGEVDMKAASCLTFVTGKAPAVPPACCRGLQGLVQKVATTADKRAVCNCLKAAIEKFTGVQDKFLGQIPGACKIKVGFPVSLNTNCNAIN